jgi:hypothetical protein
VVAVSFSKSEKTIKAMLDSSSKQVVKATPGGRKGKRPRKADTKLDFVTPSTNNGRRKARRTSRNGKRAASKTRKGGGGTSAVGDRVRIYWDRDDEW